MDDRSRPRIPCRLLALLKYATTPGTPPILNLIAWTVLMSGIAACAGPLLVTLARPRDWEDLPSSRAQIFRNLRSAKGERMILEENAFIEILLPKLIVRTLTRTEMDAYRLPYIEPESRWPMLIWPRQLPIAGEPADVVKIFEGYGQWLLRSPLPKLFINAEPGSLLIGRSRDFCRSWPNQQEITVRGIHFVQEDSPHEIGSALARFVRQTRPDRKS